MEQSEFVDLFMTTVKGLDKDIDDLEIKSNKAFDDLWAKIDKYQDQHSALRQDVNAFKLEVEKSRNECVIEINKSISKVKDAVNKLDTRDQLTTQDLTLKSGWKIVLVTAIVAVLPAIAVAIYVLVKL